VPMVTLATQEHFLPQDANWDLLHGLRVGKGCYPGQEIIARAKNLARLKVRTVLLHVDTAPPAPGTRLYAAAFGDQACGTVANAAEAPDGGSDLLAVVQWDALSDPPLHLGTLDGPPLAQLPMPYVVPVPVAPERPRL
jgi:tRNA-modifying protein YgfZ